MKKAIVIGSSSGIGRALAKVLASDGYELGLAGRRLELMEALRSELPTRSYVRRMDLLQPEESRQGLVQLIREMGTVDLIVINSGVGHSDPDWPREREIIGVNVIGFAAVANQAMEHFLERGSGHIVGITSISALRGLAAAYSGSKAFAATYLEGLRLKADKSDADIWVTDVKPGYVETPMTSGRNDMFWLASADTAARQIYAAIRQKKRHVYVTRRWQLVAWLMRSIPYPLLARLSRARR